MSRMIAWFAENHVAANLLMILLIVGGLITIPTIGQEMVPDIDLDIVTISVVYPGASPDEVEEAIVIRIEEAMDGLPGIKRVRSTASEGMASVVVEMQAGEDLSRRLADVRARVDAIEGFPNEARRPVVKQAEIGRIVLAVTISGAVDERTLKHAAEQVRDELTALPEISQVSVASVRPYEIQIEVSEEGLQRFGVTFDDVAAAVRRSSLDQPGGSIRAAGGEILLRAKGKATDATAFEKIALVSRRDGTRLEVGDVATVTDGFAEIDQYSTFDGELSAMVHVYQVGDEKMLDVSNAVKRYAADSQTTLSPGISLTIWMNAGDFLDDRLGGMFRNARAGFVLVVGVLAIFLRLRLALWVSLGIPIAFLGALAVLPTLDQTINWISLLGFIVVLGIVVDDAIVVGENTYTEQSRTGDKLSGAIRGAQGIAVPVVFGVFTTIAAFAPMLFIPGSMGKLTAVLPTVVIACLLFSLVEAMFVLPAHLGSGSSRPDDAPTNPLSVRWRLLQDRVARGLDRMIEHRYRPALEWCLEWRYLTIAVALSLLMVSVGLLAGGWLRFTFQEPVEGDVINAMLTMAPGTPVDETARAIEHLQAAAREVQAEADAERDSEAGSIFLHTMVSIGEHPSSQYAGPLPNLSATGGAANLGEVQVEMVGPEHRDIGTNEMQRRWRERVGDIAGAEELSFHNSLISAGMPIELELRGQDLESLRRAASDLKSSLASYPGVFDIADSFRGGKQELQFRVLPSAEALGVSLQDVGRQVRQAFHGEEAQRLQRGRNEVKVMVRYPAESRRSLGDVEAMRIRTREGDEVPFTSVATAELGRGFSSIRRVDRKRVVTITADVDVALANANEIVADLEERVLPDLLASHPGVHHSFEGEQAEQRMFMSAMLRGQVLAFLVIYALLAVPLRSYIQPLIIMSAIPFGLVGAIAGHLLLGYDFSMYSIIGFVALSGVVVNASLVLVDHVNHLRSQGARLAEAVRDAGSARLRAIMLTSLTTFVGLSPMMFERSMSARFMIPMAIALGFGVIFASLITLFFVPCAHLIVEDLSLLVRGRRDDRAPARVKRAARESSNAVPSEPLTERDAPAES
ncbi:MAG: efflux RND transporter permease subunit [bacterium]|nr:efflux RND transporter permease subunit [bacterium]